MARLRTGPARRARSTSSGAQRAVPRGRRYPAADPESPRRPHIGPILITGADGLIGSILRRELADLELRLLTRAPIEAPSHVADIAELDAIAPAFAGVEAVIHLAAESSPQAAWSELVGPNVIGLRNIFEAARLAGVGRVVYASSTHVVAGHERAAAPALYELDDTRRFGVDVPVRPDSLYGATKAFGEVLGRYYADAHGLAVICLRIGWVWGGPDEEFLGGQDERDLADWQRQFHRRSRAIWLSQRDCGQLFRRALAADVRWAVVYGTSDNPRQIWDLEPARRLLGFRPQDSAPVEDGPD